jgi:hypothetical protein
MLELAEAGRLELLCPNCGDTWKPSPADQKLYAANLRKLIAPMPE